MTNVLVVCAGHGQRFKDAGIDIPKPIIAVENPDGSGPTPMVKLTTDSLAFVDELGPGRLAFAVLQEHIDEWFIDIRLSTMYNEPTIIPFPKVTRGNLETAYQAVSYMLKHGWNMMEPLYILDSDNMYGGSNVESFMYKKGHKDVLFASVCYFKPIDEKTHWCFAQMDAGKVWNLLEKHPNAIALGAKPLMGTFYFSTAKLFLDAAEAVFFAEDRSTGEFYMSQGVQRLIDDGVNVYGCKVTDVVPLGTPEDVKRYERAPIRIAIDLDDTILHCKKAGEEYGNEKLQDGVIKTMKKWREDGHYIIIHTARHTATCDGNIGKVLARQGLKTLQWLADNDVPYDEIWWSKPHADIFVDDKGYRHVPGDWQSTDLAVKRFIEGGKV